MSAERPTPGGGVAAEKRSRRTRADRSPQLEAAADTASKAVRQAAAPEIVNRLAARVEKQVPEPAGSRQSPAAELASIWQVSPQRQAPSAAYVARAVALDSEAAQVALPGSP